MDPAKGNELRDGGEVRGGAGAALDCTTSELLGEKPADSVFLTPRQKQLLDMFAQLNDSGKDFLLSQTESILRQPAFRQDGSVASAI